MLCRFPPRIYVDSGRYVEGRSPVAPCGSPRKACAPTKTKTNLTLDLIVESE